MIESVWVRIHKWLDANAPASYGKLRPGASSEAIQSAELAIGLNLPDDLRASYRLHDGQLDEPGLIGGEGWCLLSLREMVEQWRRWSLSNPLDAGCVPIARHAAGDYVLLDLRPDANEPGHVLVQRHDLDGPDPIAPSYLSWLETFADQLEDGEFAYSEADGCVMYADEIDFG